MYPIPRCPLRTLRYLSAFLLLLTACASPNRGIWRGTFEGSVAGTVEFRINSRGTELTGTMVGETKAGALFEAEMEGKIRGEHFYATFEGRGRSGMMPIPFEGFLRGSLAEGEAGGDWECEIKVAQTKMSGTWRADQVSAEE